MFSKEELQEFKESRALEGQSTQELESLTRNQFIGWLNAKASELKAQISHEVTLSAEGKEERIKKAKEDFLFFATTYFPHYFTLQGFSELHKALTEAFLRIASGTGGHKFVFAADIRVIF